MLRYNRCITNSRENNGRSKMFIRSNWVKHVVGCAVTAAVFCGFADPLTVGIATIGNEPDGTARQIQRTDGKYAVVFLNTSGSIAFTPAPGFLLEEALVVAGGGAGGGNVSAGGGAGGYLPLDFTASPLTISGSATIVVGAGGQARDSARGNFMIVGRIYLHHALSQDKSHIGHRMKIHHLCHQYHIIGRQSQRFLMRL